MNKKIFIIFFVIFVGILSLILTIYNSHGENYKETTINGILVKGDNTR